MGAGKTSAGAVLARILDLPFYDLDSMICERRSGGIEGIMSSLGEPGFRMLESELLAEVCSLAGSLVVSTGGGVVISEKNRRVMEEAGVVIYLSAKLETLICRISEDKSAARPLLEVGDPVSKAADMLCKRKPFYETADVTIETDGLSAEEVARKAADVLCSDGVWKIKKFEKMKESGR